MATGEDLNDSVELLRQLSKQSFDVEHFLFSDELELLQNVYFDDLQIVNHTNSNETVLTFHVTPSTADDKEKQFVYCDLKFIIDNQYPSSKPDTLIVQSRGLSDAHLESISEGLCHLSLENLGSPMIYDLVEYARDSLTDNNRPCGKCPLCQYEFQDEDQYIRTECYHYFHPLCLARYIDLCYKELKQKAKEDEETRWSQVLETRPQELECPVCRVAIGNRDPCLVTVKSIPLTIEEDNTFFKPDSKLLSWQKKMAMLYQKQLDQGGIINLSAKDSVIDETWVSRPSVVQETEKVLSKSTEETNSGEGDPITEVPNIPVVTVDSCKKNSSEKESSQTEAPFEHVSSSLPRGHHYGNHSNPLIKRQYYKPQHHRHQQNSYTHYQTGYHGKGGYRNYDRDYRPRVNDRRQRRGQKEETEGEVNERGGARERGQVRYRGRGRARERDEDQEKGGTRDLGGAKERGKARGRSGGRGEHNKIYQTSESHTESHGHQ